MLFFINPIDFDSTQIIQLLGISGFIIFLIFLSLKIFSKYVLERRLLIVSFILLSFGLVGASVYSNMNGKDAGLNPNSPSVGMKPHAPAQSMDGVTAGRDVSMQAPNGTSQTMTDVTAGRDAGMQSFPSTETKK